MVLFDGKAGDRVSIVADPPGHGCASLLDPSNATLGSDCSISWTSYYRLFIEPIILPTTGTYAVLVKPTSGYGQTTVTTYLAPDDATASAVVSGPEVSVATATPGQNAEVTFQATAGQRISLAVTGRFCYFDGDWTEREVFLVTPGGGYIASEPECGDYLWYGGQAMTVFLDTYVMPETGPYTLRIDRAGPTTIAAGVRVHEVPPDLALTTTIDATPVELPIVTPGQNAVVTFSGTAGQSINVRQSGLGGCQLSIVLRAPSLAYVAANAPPTDCRTTLEAVTLPETGEYRVELNPIAEAIGTILLSVYTPPSPVEATIAADGQPVSVTTTAPDQIARLAFSATAGQRVSLKLVRGAPSVPCCAYYSILNPDGSVLQPPTCFDCAGQSFMEPKALVATGGHTIVVETRANPGTITPTSGMCPPTYPGPSRSAGGPSPWPSACPARTVG